MLQTAHNAEEFMRTRARVSPFWPGGEIRGRIRCSRLISRRSGQNLLQTGRAIRFQHRVRGGSCVSASGARVPERDRRAGPPVPLLHRTEGRAGPDRLNRIPRRLSELLPGLVLCNFARGA